MQVINPKPPNDYQLSKLDILIYARNLAAQQILKALDTGAFNEDLAMFCEKDQKRIVAQLQLLARQWDAPGLADESKKSQENAYVE